MLTLKSYETAGMGIKKGVAETTPFKPKTKNQILECKIFVKKLTINQIGFLFNVKNVCSVFVIS
jgi:hypothetical protein